MNHDDWGTWKNNAHAEDANPAAMMAMYADWTADRDALRGLVREAIDLFNNEPTESSVGEEDARWTAGYTDWRTRADAFLGERSSGEDACKLDAFDSALEASR
jgi:hypothetical protein